MDWGGGTEVSVGEGKKSEGGSYDHAVEVSPLFLPASHLQCVSKSVGLH